MLDLKNRILLNNGTSIVNNEYATKILLEHGVLPDHIKVIESKDSNYYKEKYGKDISATGEEIEPCPDISYNEIKFQKIIAGIVEPRDDTDVDEHFNRLETELNYFENNNLNYIIVKMFDLINQFKKDGTVWGVGRGSACACYIFYLLEVHDVNPIRFNINFKEFSKEE